MESSALLIIEKKRRSLKDMLSRAILHNLVWTTASIVPMIVIEMRFSVNLYYCNSCRARQVYMTKVTVIFIIKKMCLYYKYLTM